MFNLKKVLLVFLFTPIIAHADCSYFNRTDGTCSPSDGKNSSNTPEAHYTYIGLKGGTQSFASNHTVNAGTSAAITGIYTGVRVNNSLAFEVEAINTENFNTTAGAANTSIYSMSGLNQIALGYLDLFIRVGLSSTTTTYVGNTNISTTSSNNLLGLSYGIGTEISLGKNAGLRIMHDRYRLTLQDNLNSDFVSACITYRF